MLFSSVLSMFYQFGPRGTCLCVKWFHTKTWATGPKLVKHSRKWGMASVTGPKGVHLCVSCEGVRRVWESSVPGKSGKREFCLVAFLKQNCRATNMTWKKKFTNACTEFNHLTAHALMSAHYGFSVSFVQRTVSRVHQLILQSVLRQAKLPQYNQLVINLS